MARRPFCASGRSSKSSTGKSCVKTAPKPHLELASISTLKAKSARGCLNNGADVRVRLTSRKASSSFESASQGLKGRLTFLVRSVRGLALIDRFFKKRR